MSEQRKIDFDGLRMVGQAVEEAPDARFCMGVWECGTQACAIGWFCKANPEDRLRLTQTPYGDTPSPVLDGLEDYEAIGARFGITDQEARCLFGQGGSNAWGKATFLARLRLFILDHEPKPAPAKPRRRRPFGGATLHEFTFTIEREDSAGEVNELPLQVTYTHYQGRGAPDDESEATIQFARDAEGKDWYPLLTAEEDMRMQEKAWEHAENQGGNYDEHDPDDRVEHAERFELV